MLTNIRAIRVPSRAFRAFRSQTCIGTKCLSTSAVHRDLFGGTKTIHGNGSNQGLSAPGNKGETTSNPADLFKKNDILMYSDKPLNYIETVRSDGFYLANHLLITSPDKDGNVIGAAMLQSETFEVNFSNNGYNIINGFIVEFNEKEILEIFRKVHPKPEIVVIGLGKKSRMLSESNKKLFSSLGIQLEVGDSNNAAQIFDLLATERPNVIGALLLPPNV
ncbi:uncharacterized protein CANTADRAFT_339044 [Suhomyces tanzawaensis NRRL Y-17324]|uniref:NADH dehydrogenase [ubiquinone] 1 alpha subcomplex assembly factor 3 n=1 Tax=Suhomyces tanzawaensis NRRL Y-17324 TaxID=984487 RepID=A0A1E4SMR0_9ASCO|nr:uncharacterized protein CANTADRAFT_339044 [Suhomyces tanzawaensis NRRL Y-17324]ODV80672.1 hypothetical protein CANTADRAFT_339044 [Suhomyces tanzawaensis NRRL Y-17324]